LANAVRSLNELADWGSPAGEFEIVMSVTPSPFDSYLELPWVLQLSFSAVYISMCTIVADLATLIGVSYFFQPLLEL
jgi:hypothetical protein